MTASSNPLSPNAHTRNPELHTSLEVLWGGLGDLVHETENGSYRSVLDYFILGRSVTSQQGVVIGERETLTFEHMSMLACWVSPEKSNGVIVGHNREYALRIVDNYTHRGGPIGNIVAQTEVMTEIMVGRWATGCAVKIGDGPIEVESCLPCLEELQADIDLNTVLENNKERFETKKRSYQAFRDKARLLQEIDVSRMLDEEPRTRFGDVCHEGENVSTRIDDIRRSANLSNGMRLTLFCDKPLWAKKKSLDTYIDKA